MTYYYYNCNECKTHGVNTYSISKRGGGNYRRPNRHYSASICRWCVQDTYRAATTNSFQPDYIPNQSSLTYGFEFGSIQRVKNQIDAHRAEVGDAAVAVEDASIYFDDYKRIGKVMRERLDAETAEYREAFLAYVPA